MGGTDKESGQVVAAGTLLVELKVIHSCGTVGHVEDVVVAASCRGLKLGQRCAFGTWPYTSRVSLLDVSGWILQHCESFLYKTAEQESGFGCGRLLLSHIGAPREFADVIRTEELEARGRGSSRLWYRSCVSCT